MDFTISTEEILQERIKELSCLYAVSSVIVKQEREVEKTLKEICFILKNAWRFSEFAIIELQLDKHYYATTAIPQDTVFQETSILIFNTIKGFLRVHYSSKSFRQQHFLDEEQKLLNKVALDISAFYERHLNKDKEELLKRSVERVDRLSILGEITAGIAHELNTPLGNILGFAEFIQERSKEKQSQMDSAKIIKAAIYSREVVKKLMFFSCEMPQNMRFVKIIPIVSEALSLLGPNFKKANLSYEVDFKNLELEAQLDPIQLTQVLFNILINSIYVAPPNTCIQITVYTSKDSFFIEIADQGPGIPEKIKTKIFEPFFTTKPIGEGSGLGLSVVHGIVKSHKGDIGTFNNTPKGTVFQVRLPLKVS
ncbi:sensor histidine kinase [Flavobacterium crassostreae]|uniref:sensor histidine kinase n=1 Tax=Flavobacterium crassostreae TaxID=1763534 RepID=UPI0008A4B303|nr:ATP-binding protein [Flavobacterium crassostreae]